MNSHSCCDWIDDFIDDDLSVDRRAQFELHLASCGACRGDLECVNELDSLLTKAWLSVDLGVGQNADVTAVRGAVPLDTVQINQSSFVSMIATLAAIILLTFGIYAFIDMTAQVGRSGLTPGETVAVNGPDAVHQAPLADNGAADSGYQISYASATFDSSTTGHKIATNKEFTVYQVVPKVIYSKTN